MVKVYVVKDEEGILRPQAGIWESEGRYGQAVLDEWNINTSKKKHFRGCTLVKAEITEIQ